MEKIRMVFLLIGFFVLLASCKKNVYEGSKPPTIEENTKTYKVKDVTFVMKKIDEVSQADLGNPTERHTSSLSAYWIAETEVTQELWEIVMKSNPSFFDASGAKDSVFGMIDTNPKGEDNQRKRPVDSVSWYDCIAFCNELTKICMSENECVYYRDGTWTNIYTIEDAKNETLPYMYKTGKDAENIGSEMNKKGFRLPTNDEWEWAAKAKKHELYAGTEDIEQLHEYAWIKLDSEHTKWATREVKKLKANDFGLYDMSGNVMEWCWDGFGKFASDDVGKNPITKNDKEKVLKGASYFTGKDFMHLFGTLENRMRLEPVTEKSRSQCGIRLAYFD